MLSLNYRLHDCVLVHPKREIGLRYRTRRNPNSAPIRSSSPSLQEIERSPRSSSSSRDVNLGEKALASATFPPIKAAKRVVLVRHGQSTWNEEGRIQGSSDFSVLTQKGESQAETSRQMLIDDTFDVCFTSPLIRSKRTAEIIWDGRGKEMVPELELREIDLYSFQGLLKHEGKERFGEAYRKWQIDAPNFNIDGHYPVRELWARARDCWNKILIHEGKSVLVVAHNAVNQALVATAIGLSTEYFRVLLQSNCGVSVLDFTPRLDDGSPHICLNRLNQTPSSPVAASSSAGRKTSMRIILACHGSTQISTESDLQNLGNGPMNMLGIIQSQKTAELLLDLKLDSIVSSPQIASVETAMTISKVQEAADCLGADCVPRYVEMKQLQELEVEPILPPSNEARINFDHTRPQIKMKTSVSSTSLTGLQEETGKQLHALTNGFGSEALEYFAVCAVNDMLILLSLDVNCITLKKFGMRSFHSTCEYISHIEKRFTPSGQSVQTITNLTSNLKYWWIIILCALDKGKGVTVTLEK
ncbi:hypothetical protein Syun_016453 [Stephania yunnanensis]|uniref:2-carboxy-D-arabinitol-1-phosphatase n=1 Tax=Stephania yunnanensis TaxID=152371 RepID=A0AAP0J4X0_9MAGN